MSSVGSLEGWWGSSNQIAHWGKRRQGTDPDPSQAQTQEWAPTAAKPAATRLWCRSREQLLFNTLSSQSELQNSRVIKSGWARAGKCLDSFQPCHLLAGVGVGGGSHNSLSHSSCQISAYGHLSHTPTSQKTSAANAGCCDVCQTCVLRWVR